MFYNYKCKILKSFNRQMILRAKARHGNSKLCFQKTCFLHRHGIWCVDSVRSSISLFKIYVSHVHSLCLHFGLKTTAQHINVTLWIHCHLWVVLQILKCNCRSLSWICNSRACRRGDRHGFLVIDSLTLAMFLGFLAVLVSSGVFFMCLVDL